MEQTDILSLSLAELESCMKEMGQPKFRAKQIFSWLHDKRVLTFGEMTNLPAALREKLETECAITSLEVERKLVSQLDGTVKYLYRLADGQHIESVRMAYEHGISLCISSQVGCKMGCAFCASTKAGFVRNLTASEILEQVYAAGRDAGRSARPQRRHRRHHRPHRRHRRPAPAGSGPGDHQGRPARRRRETPRRRHRLVSRLVRRRRTRSAGRGRSEPGQRLPVQADS